MDKFDRRGKQAHMGKKLINLHLDHFAKDNVPFLSQSNLKLRLPGVISI